MSVDKDTLFSFILNIDLSLYDSVFQLIKKLKPELSDEEKEDLVEQALSEYRRDVKLFLYEKGLLADFLRETFSFDEIKISEAIENAKKDYNNILQKYKMKQLFPPRK